MTGPGTPATGPVVEIVVVMPRLDGQRVVLRQMNIPLSVGGVRHVIHDHAIVVDTANPRVG
jgi:hypothetical protein